MKIETIQNETYTLSCSGEELRAMLAGIVETKQAWSEEYAQKTGFEKKTFQEVFDDINPIYKSCKNCCKLTLSDEQMRICLEGLRRLLEIWDWEYPVRTGFDKEEIRHVYTDLGNIYKFSKHWNRDRTDSQVQQDNAKCP